MQTTTSMVGNLSRAEVSEQVNLSRTINAWNGGARGGGGHRGEHGSRGRGRGVLPLIDLHIAPLTRMRARARMGGRQLV